MNQPLRRFIARAPRYVLQPQDDRFLRFAHRDGRNGAFTTRFLNISATGLAFLTERSGAPGIGETIKVEFPIPGGDKVAWWARVVRLEEPPPSAWWQTDDDFFETGEAIIVGIEFHDLPDGHRNQIERAINLKFNELVKDRRRRMLQRLLEISADHFWRGVVIVAIGTLLTFALLYALSRPDETYDAERGAPWGQRYRWLNPFDDGQ